MPYTRDLSALLGELAAAPGVESAEVLGVGGGCENLHVALTDGRLIVATEAFLDGPVWVTEPSVPDTEAGPWFVTVQTRGAYENGDMPTIVAQHADRAEFVRAVESLTD